MQEKTVPLFHTAEFGDIVTIRTPHGQERRGRVVLVYTTHLVLNGGGKHGTPLVANDRNTVRVQKKRRTA